MVADLPIRRNIGRRWQHGPSRVFRLVLVDSPEIGTLSIEAQDGTEAIAPLQCRLGS